MSRRKRNPTGDTAKERLEYWKNQPFIKQAAVDAKVILREIRRLERENKEQKRYLYEVGLV